MPSMEDVNEMMLEENRRLLDSQRKDDAIKRDQKKAKKAKKINPRNCPNQYRLTKKDLKKLQAGKSIVIKYQSPIDKYEPVDKYQRPVDIEFDTVELLIIPKE